MKKNLKYIFSTLLTLVGVTIPATIVTSCSNNSQTNNSENDNGNNNPNPELSLSQKLHNAFKVSSIDQISKFGFTNENFSNDDIINITNNIINEFDFELDKLISKWSNNYLKNFLISRNNLCSGEIIENNIKVTKLNTISGNIKFKFIWNQDMNHSYLAASRAKDDVEIQNFIFENVKIEPYINNGLTNYLSYYITPTKVEKKLTTSYKYQKSYDLTFLEPSKIYLDSVIDYKIQFNNSLFSLDLNWFTNNINSSIIANNEEKKFIIDVMNKLINSSAKLIMFGNNPINDKDINEPVLCIELSEEYNISDSFLKNFLTDLNCFLSFIQEKTTSKLIGKTLYINCKKSLNTYINPESDSLIDNNTNKPYNSTYRDLLFLYESYRETIDVKNKLISNNVNILDNLNWLEYKSNLSDLQKAEKIYEFSLPFVSYGTLDAQVSETSGYINGKILCDGYAKLFMYIGSLLNINTISIVGNVFDGAIPGQTQQGGLHAWNLIKVDDNWLWCDPTWDDSINPNAPTFQKNNFLKNTSEFFTNTTHLNINNWDSGESLPIKINK